MRRYNKLNIPHVHCFNCETRIFPVRAMSAIIKQSKRHQEIETSGHSQPDKHHLLLTIQKLHR